MVVVTERAKDALLQLKKESAEIDVPEIGFRLAPAPTGELRLVPDLEKPADQVVEHGGSKVLLIGGGVSEMLEGSTLDCRPTTEGPKLVLSRMGGEEEGAS